MDWRDVIYMHWLEDTADGSTNLSWEAYYSEIAQPDYKM